MNFFSNLYTNCKKHFVNNPKNNSKEILDHYFFENKYYLLPNASEDDFSKLLNITKDRLRSYSQLYLINSFQDLIDDSRYKHIMAEFQNPINTDLPIESVIKLCGFENNLAFAAYVKEKHENSYTNINI